MSIDRLQTHYGFTKMPFGRNIPPQALHAHPSHREAVARIDWCVSQRQLGVITGEVGAGKTVAVRAALAQLEPSRHQVIYIPDPTVTMRGIHTQIVTALGGTPAFYSGVLASQTAALLAGELDERSRLPVVVIDEAHLLSNTDLEALRMLTLCRAEDYAERSGVWPDVGCEVGHARSRTRHNPAVWREAVFDRSVCFEKEDSDGKAVVDMCDWSACVVCAGVSC